MQKAWLELASEKALVQRESEAALDRCGCWEAEHRTRRSEEANCSAAAMGWQELSRYNEQEACTALKERELTMTKRSLRNRGYKYLYDTDKFSTVACQCCKNTIIFIRMVVSNVESYSTTSIASA
jgi:hypothetical protein